MVQLPDEILLYILQCLPSLSEFTHKADFEDYKQTSKTLVNICQTSKALRNFAQPLLYRAYIEDENDHDRRFGGRRYGYRVITKLQLFLQTLIHRPDFAAKIEYLRLADLQNRLDGGRTDPELSQMFVRASNSLPAITDALTLEAHTQQSYIWRTNWRRHLKKGAETEGAEVALLLALVPSLKSLDVCASERNTGLCVNGLFRDVARTDKWKLVTRGENKELFSFDNSAVFTSLRLQTLSRLKAVTLSAEAESPINSHFLTFLAATLTLETLSVVGDVQPFFPSVSWRWPFDHIHNLSFKECTLSSVDLRSLVTSCGSLESLRIKFSAHKENMNIDRDVLLRYLYDSSETLEELQLFRPKGVPTNIIAFDSFDLRCFNQLKALEINFDFLFKLSDSEPSFTSLLPTSLEDIYLRMGDKRFAKHLQVLAEEYKSFPNLKVVDIGIDDMPSIHAMDQEEVDWKLALNNCAKELRKGGIECNVPVEGTHFNLSCGDD